MDVQGDTASATYESTVTLRLNGKVVQDSKQTCTDRFSRQGTRWLLEHSTVSSMKESSSASERQRRQDNRVADVTYSPDHRRILSITNILDTKSDDYRLCTKANLDGVICAVVYLEQAPCVITGFAITLQSGRYETH